MGGIDPGLVWLIAFIVIVGAGEPKLRLSLQAVRRMNVRDNRVYEFLSI
jgi:hypothetical protein